MRIDNTVAFSAALVLAWLPACGKGEELREKSPKTARGCDTTKKLRISFQVKKARSKPHSALSALS